MYKASRDGKVAYIFGDSPYHSLTELPGDFKEKYFDPSAHILVSGALDDFEEIFLPPGETLEQKLSPQSYQKLEDVFRNTAMEDLIPFSMPVAVLTALKVAVEEKSAMTKNMTKEIEMEAKSAGKLSYLDESPDYITPTLMTLATADELDQWLASMEDSSSIFTSIYNRLTQVADCYRRSDIPCITKTMYEPSGPLSAEDSKVIADVAFKQRGRTWIPTIEEYLANTGEGQHIFISVSAKHLVVKDDDLLSLLRERGFTVESVYQL